MGLEQLQIRHRMGVGPGLEQGPDHRREPLYRIGIPYRIHLRGDGALPRVKSHL